MNPITSAIHEFVMLGRHIVRIAPDDRLRPTKAIFYFADGVRSEVPVGEEPEAFERRWEEAGEYIRRLWAVPPVDVLD